MKKINRENVWYIGLFAAVFVLAFAVMQNIPLFGDDYYYATFWGENFWSMHKEHYLLANGRAIVHFLASVFVALPPILWQILNSLLIAVIALFAAMLAGKKASAIAAVTAAAMIMSLGVDITRESVYWLTGSFNYVYPFALMVTFWYLLTSGRGKLPVLYILAFFSAATTEQNGMMTLGVVVLYLLDMRFIRKEKPTAPSLCLLIPAIIGFVSVYFAPATFVRYGIETEKGMLEVMREQLPMLYYNFISKKYMLPFISFNFGVMGLYLIATAQKRWERLAALANAVSIVLVLIISKTPYVYATAKTVMLVALLTVLFALSLVLVVIKLLKNKPEGYLNAVIAIILAVGTQFMMSASPVSGPRTMLCGILNLVIFDIMLLAFCFENKRFYMPVLVICAAFAAYGVMNYIETYVGYNANFPITAKNEEKIAEYLNAPSETLEQYTLPYPDHCWSMPYQSSYHLYYYKVHYNLPENTEIIWIQQ
ncbi:MAG: hypothetical protein IJ366_03345 [Clostridia bacterium]|nr:hypothetical protein [Clostridia bacterium]